MDRATYSTAQQQINNAAPMAFNAALTAFFFSFKNRLGAWNGAAAAAASVSAAHRRRLPPAPPAAAGARRRRLSRRPPLTARVRLETYSSRDLPIFFPFFLKKNLFLGRIRSSRANEDRRSE